jgi:site-specific DNA-methyltransferase (cytosine-N4-specific)
MHPRKLVGRLRPSYQTKLGAAYLGDCLATVGRLPEGSVDLIFTSPPYALHFKKEYGNVDQQDYVSWFMGFAPEFRRVLKDTGSLVIDIGGSWQPGAPVRSLYHFELLIELVKRGGFHLAQEFYWYNPAKLPAPAEWVNVRKIRVKDSVECLWWLSKQPFPKADNRNVLQEYSADMLRLLERGYRAKQRPSGHKITSKFVDNGGSIPPNLFTAGNNDSNGSYLALCKQRGIKPHPARFPIQLPTFFVRYLTDPGDLVLDPFAGSNTTGEACERENRRWIACEMNEAYLEGGRLRFETTVAGATPTRRKSSRASTAASAGRRRTTATADLFSGLD